MGVLGGHNEGVESVGAPEAGEDCASHAITTYPVYLATDLQRPVLYVEEIVYGIVGE